MSKILRDNISQTQAQTAKAKDTLKLAIENTLNDEERQQLEILQDVVKWAYVYFGWTAYDYQIPILKNIINDSQAVFRLGRRLGKTELMCILILWYAFTQYNKKAVTNETEDVYDILIVAPFEKQIDLIFKRLKELILASPAYQNVLVRDVKHNLKLVNGTNILGITAGSKTGSGANNTRGQRADSELIIQLNITSNYVIISLEVNVMYKNKNWLEQQIKIHGSIKKISKATGCAETTLKRWCDKFDLKPTNTRQPTDRVTKEFLIKQYSLGKEIREIAKEFGLSTATIVTKNKDYGISAVEYNPKYKYNDAEWLTEQFELYGNVSNVAEQTGYPRTNISRAATRFNIYEKMYTREKNNFINESYFEIIDSPDKAYYLGLIMADGNIYEYDDGRLQFSLKLKSTDHSIIDAFSKSVGFPKDKIRYGHLMRKDTITYFVEIRSYNVAFCENLIKHGIVKVKSGTEHIPTSIPSEYIRDFIRGYIDGDGWVLHNNLGVCSTSIQVINDIRNFCSNYIDVTTSINKYNGVYRYQINKKNDIATICNVLYYPGCIALERKYKQAKFFIESII